MQSVQIWSTQRVLAYKFRLGKSIRDLPPIHRYAPLAMKHTWLDAELRTESIGESPGLHLNQEYSCG